MRTIKFRGKFQDGKWEYGGLRFGDMGQAYILPHGASHRVELVNRNTVGQFTGLLDKNGKEIYEGDIYQRPLACGNCASTIKRENFQVIFNHGAFTLKPLQKRISGNDNPVRLGSDYNLENGEVIGNIYENPDLLTKSQ